MPDVHLIAAIGRRGQLGLDDALPWGREVGDLPWFREQTRGGIVVLGRRTADAVGELPGRLVVSPERGEKPAAFLAALARIQPGRTIWIAGGAKTYSAFAPFCGRFIVTRIAYDGPADAWFDLAWLFPSLLAPPLLPASGENAARSAG